MVTEIGRDFLGKQRLELGWKKRETIPERRAEGRGSSITSSPIRPLPAGDIGKGQVVSDKFEMASSVVHHRESEWKSMPLIYIIK